MLNAASAILGFSVVSAPALVLLQAFPFSPSASSRRDGPGQSLCLPGTQWRYTKLGTSELFACNCPPNDKCTGMTNCTLVPASGDQWQVVVVSSSLCSFGATPGPLIKAQSASSGSSSVFTALALGLGIGLGLGILLLLGIFIFRRRCRNLYVLKASTKQIVNEKNQIDESILDHGIQGNSSKIESRIPSFGDPISLQSQANISYAARLVFDQRKQPRTSQIAKYSQLELNMIKGEFEKSSNESTQGSKSIDESNHFCNIEEHLEEQRLASRSSVDTNSQNAFTQPPEVVLGIAPQNSESNEARHHHPWPYDQETETSDLHPRTELVSIMGLQESKFDSKVCLDPTNLLFNLKNASEPQEMEVLAEYDLGLDIFDDTEAKEGTQFPVQKSLEQLDTAHSPRLCAPELPQQRPLNLTSPSDIRSTTVRRIDGGLSEQVLLLSNIFILSLKHFEQVQGEDFLSWTSFVDKTGLV